MPKIGSKTGRKHVPTIKAVSAGNPAKECHCGYDETIKSDAIKHVSKRKGK